MTTLVTGGTGFVGGYVVRQLAQSGEAVVCYDLSPVAAYLDDLFEGTRPPSVTIETGDITDVERLDAVCRAHGVDQIVHLAAMIGAPAEQHLSTSIAVNVTGTVNVFETALAQAMRKVVWASSTGIYGPRSLNPEGRIDDDSIADPSSAYGAAKALCERLSVLYARNRGLDVTGVRFSTVYGYGKQFTPGRKNWLDELIARPAVGEQGCIVSGGAGSFDFQYAEDAAASVMCALAADKTEGKSYLTHGDQRPVREAVDFVRRILPDSAVELSERTTYMVFGGDGKGTRFMFGSRPTATDRLYETQLAEKEIGYAPAYSMERGVLESINLYRRAAGLAPIEKGN